MWMFLQTTKKSNNKASASSKVSSKASFNGRFNAYQKLSPWAASTAAFGDAFFVFLGVVFMALIWQLGAASIEQNALNNGFMAGAGALILPTPTAVLRRVVALASAPEFWQAMVGSTGRALLGFFVALVTGTLCGIAAGVWRPVRLVLYPVVQLLRAIPVMSVILYLLLFVATDWVAVWVSFLIVFPMLYTNVVAGFDGIDLHQLEMAKLYQMSRAKILRHVYLPAFLPYWLAGCLTGMGLNIKAVVTAEAMSLPASSFGALMSEARNYLDTEGLLAITVWIIVLALVLDVILLMGKWLLTEGRRAYVIHRRKP